MTDATPPARYDDLDAIFLNCTLKRSPQSSNTEALLDVPRSIMQRQGVDVSVVRPVDLDIATGIMPDMTEHGWETDAWPKLFERIRAADILIIGTPIWLGEKSSVATRVVERLYAQSADQNEAGQYVFYGKVGGCVVTGNEDGVKHCAMNLLYSLQHLGYTIPPQAETGWVGEAGPGPSYADEDSGGPENAFTQQTATFMTWNLLHFARMLKDAGGVPTYGNQVDAWEDGADFGHPNPVYR